MRLIVWGGVRLTRRARVDLARFRLPLDPLTRNLHGPPSHVANLGLIGPVRVELLEPRVPDGLGLGIHEKGEYLFAGSIDRHIRVELSHLVLHQRSSS